MKEGEKEMEEREEALSGAPGNLLTQEEIDALLASINQSSNPPLELEEAGPELESPELEEWEKLEETTSMPTLPPASLPPPPNGDEGKDEPARPAPQPGGWKDVLAGVVVIFIILAVGLFIGWAIFAPQKAQRVSPPQAAIATAERPGGLVPVQPPAPEKWSWEWWKAQKGKIIFWSILGMLFIYFLKWFKIIGPDQMAVRIEFGKPIGFVKSGIRIIPWLPGCYFVFYPKKTYVLDYPELVVYSTEGFYQGRNYGAQKLKVKVSAHINFPRSDTLIKILEAGVPVDEEKLKDWTDDAINQSVRGALGNKTWRESAENIKIINDEAIELFREIPKFISAGFIQDDMKLIISEIFLPPELEKELLTVDQERLKAEAADSKAKQRATETAGAVKKALDQVPNMPPSEAVDMVNRHMELEKGALKDIRVSGAGSEGSPESFIAGLFELFTGNRGGGSGGGNPESERKKNPSLPFAERKKLADAADEEYTRRKKS